MLLSRKKWIKFDKEIDFADGIVAGGYTEIFFDEGPGPSHELSYSLPSRVSNTRSMIHSN